MRYGRIVSRFGMVRRKLKLLLYKLYRKAVRRITPGLLIFESNLGRSYGGNPKAIYEACLEKGWDKKYRIYWLLTRPEEVKIPGRAKKLQRESLSTLVRMHQAQVWVTDTRQPEYIIKNPKTFYMMTWHGTPLKRLGLDLANTSDTFKKQLTQDVKQWDYLLAQNETAAELFRGCFAYLGPILCGGYPRNDVLVRLREESITKGKQTKQKRTLLYAPTWREYESNESCDSRFEPPINWDKVFDLLQKEDAQLIVKCHYYVKELPDFDRYQGVIKTSNRDIAELYSECDLLIVDYSSAMFDFAVLKRPMVFFAYDLERYRNEQGFYFDYERMIPGPLARKESELLPMLKADFDFTPYEERREQFYLKFTNDEDGKATDRALSCLEFQLGHKKK